MAEISIIVPVYNVGKMLHRCVESILAQTFTDFELILVDDGSTDDSGVICDDYARKHFQIITVHQTNSGVSAARNVGIKISTGRYLMFCDGDDFVSPYWCEALYREQKRHLNSLICCNVKKVSQEVQISSVDCTEEAYSVSYYDLYLLGVSAFSVNKIYDKAIIGEKSIRFDESMIISEDVLFNVQYAKIVNNYVYIPTELYYYSQHVESAMHTYHWNMLEYSLRPFYCRIPLVEDCRMEEYCHSWFFQFCELLDNIFDPRNTEMSFIKKLAYNQKMVNTDEFQFCVHHIDMKKENPRLVGYLRHRNYYLYWLHNNLAKAKRMIRR